MAGLVLHGVVRPAPAALTLQNYRTGGLHHFQGPTPQGPVTRLVVCETLTSSARASVDVMRERGTGTHFIVGPDGTIYQHADPLEDELSPIPGRDRPTVRIASVNPCAPAYNPTGSPWTRAIEAPWALQGKYLVPPEEQADALAQLLRTLLRTPGLPIPRTWPNLEGTALRLQPAAPTRPGLYAQSPHERPSLWLTLYLWLRLEIQLDTPLAHATATRLAEGAEERIDLSSFF